MKNATFMAIVLFGSCTVNDDNPITLQGLSACRVLTTTTSSPTMTYSSSAPDLDTTLTSGWSVDFRTDPDDWYAISWKAPNGTIIGKFKTVGCMDGECAYSYQCEFENYIALKQSCGLALWAVRLLPKNKSDTTISIICDLAIDTKRGYILSKCCNHVDENDSGDFCVLNLKTMKHHPIFLEGLPETGFIYTPLDKVEFEDAGVHVWWNSTSDVGNVDEMRDTVIAL